MATESTATYIDSLVTANPDNTDNASVIDDQLKLLKACLQRTFPNITGEMSLSQAEIVTIVAGAVSASYAQSVGYVVSANYATSASLAVSVSDALALSSETIKLKTVDETATQAVNVDVSLTGLVADPQSLYKVDAVLLLGETGGSLGFFWKFNFDNAPTKGAVVQYSADVPTSAGSANWETHFLGSGECASFYPDRAGNSAHYDDYLDATTHPVNLLSNQATASDLVVILNGQFYTSDTASFNFEWGDIPGSYDASWGRTLKAGSFIKLRKLGSL